jgi:hypothetical protein
VVFGRKWISHLTSFTKGVITDKNGNFSSPIQFKIDNGSDSTIIHLSDLQYISLGSVQAGSIGGIVDDIETVSNLNLILEFTELHGKPDVYSFPLSIPCIDVPRLMAVTKGQCQGLEPIDTVTGLTLPKISILGANVMKAFKLFLGVEIHRNFVFLERSLTTLERNALIQVPLANYPDPISPSHL